MSRQDLLDGITSFEITTPRLKTQLLESGPTNGEPVLFIHGNVASSRFFEETLVALPQGYRGLAPDLRGFGKSETKPLDATRGLRDFSDDLHELVAALKYNSTNQKIHLVGWSLGGGVVMQYAIDNPTEAASLTLISSMPPYGIGGTKDTEGHRCWPDYAGSGGGLANWEFVRFLQEGLSDDPENPTNRNSPRNVMNNVYFKPPFRAKREEVFVSEMLKTKVDDYNYPGDRSSSPNWPRFAPGTWGVNNAISPIYCNLSAFAQIAPKPEVLWVHGKNDLIVSDSSPLDFGYLGKKGWLPSWLQRGWPGEEKYPPQPMIAQMRGLLEKYKAGGGRYREEYFEDCGHSPHIEKSKEFRDAFFKFLAEN